MTIGKASEFLARPQAGVTRRGLIKAGLGLAGAAGLMLPSTAAYAAAEAATGLVVTDYTLSPPGWRKGQRLTVTAIADLHAGGPNMGIARVRAVVDAALARLSAPLGVYAILGNHDWWYAEAAVRAAFAGIPVPLLENDALLIGREGERFWLAGLGDQLAHYVSPGRFLGADDLPGTLARVTTGDPVILLAHEPDIFTRVPERVALTVAGHTHGGQIRLPLLAPVWAPSQYGARFAYGHIVERGRHMVVSGGLGCSKVPLRLGVPPEIVRITLG